MLPDVFENIGRQLAGQDRRLEALERQEDALGWSLIEDIELAAIAASFNFVNIPTSFKHLAIILHARGDIAGPASSVSLRFNADAGVNYDSLRIVILHVNTLVTTAAVATTSMSPTQIPGGTAPANYFGSAFFIIPDYLDANVYQTMQAWGTTFRSVATTGMRVHLGAGWWRNIAAINAVSVIAAGNNFVQHSRCSLYGIK